MSNVKYRSMMSSTDALIWDVERDPQLRSTVMVAWELDVVPEPERMAANIDRMVRAIPRLRQRVVDGRPRPSWVDLDRIDIDRHYVVEQLPADADFGDVVDFAERWVAEPFDRSLPLWRLALLTGLPGGRAGVVIKVHHAIADGLGMVMMLGAFTDLEATPSEPPERSNVVDMPDHRHAFTRFERARFKLAGAARSFAAAPRTAVVDTARTAASAGRLVFPHRTPHASAMAARSGALRMAARTIPLGPVKSSAHRADASVNDLFVTIVTDAVRRYHWLQGDPCTRLRVHVPVNSRTSRTAHVAGNDFVPARISLDLDASGDRRVATVRDQLARLRSEPALHHITTVSGAIQRLGKPISRWIIGGMMKGVDVLASNVPGPPIPLFLAGARVDRFVAFGPPAGAALNVTLFSYDGTVHLGITVDAAAVDDHDLLLECLDESIADLVDLPAARHLVAV